MEVWQKIFVSSACLYIHSHWDNIFTDFEPSSSCHHITQSLHTLCPLSSKGNVHCTAPLNFYLAT